jgi:hypothetical protein
MLAVVLAAASLFAPAASEARADLPATAERTPAATSLVDAPPAEPANDTRLPQPGTEEEQRDYERREAESPEVEQYAGGFVIFVLVVVALVLLILILANKL